MAGAAALESAPTLVRCRSFIGTAQPTDPPSSAGLIARRPMSIPIAGRLAAASADRRGV